MDSRVNDMKCQICDGKSKHIVVGRVKVTVTGVHHGGEATTTGWIGNELEATIGIDPHGRRARTVVVEWEPQWQKLEWCVVRFCCRAIFSTDGHFCVKIMTQGSCKKITWRGSNVVKFSGDDVLNFDRRECGRSV